MQHEELLLLYIALVLRALHLNYDYTSTSTGIIHVLQACDMCLNTIHKADRACHMLLHTPRPVFILTHVKCNLVSIFKACFQTKDVAFLALSLIAEGFFFL